MEPKEFIGEIAHEIVSGRSIPFIGAGFSTYAGYPNWKKLITEITRSRRDLARLEEVDESLKSNSLQDAADTLLAQLGEDDCKARACSIIQEYEGAAETSAIRNSVNLRSWNCSTVITTNYDHLIENLLNQNGADNYLSICPPDSNIFKLDRKKIIHLHGDYNHPRAIVFSTRDIRQKIEENRLALSYLESLVFHKTLFFFGYSINEPHIIPLLHSFSRMRGDADRYYYAILGIDPKEITRFEDNHRLRVLGLNPENNYRDGEGRNLLQILNEITTECMRLEKERSHKVGVTYSEADIKDTIEKIAKLGELQKIHVPVKASITKLVTEGLKISNDKNKTFTIHVVEGEKMRIIAEGGENYRQRRSESRNRDKNLGLTGRVYRENLPFYSPNVALAESDGYYEGNPTTKSEFVVPLRDNEGSVFGVLNIESAKVEDFSNIDKAILEATALHVSTALQNKKKYDLKEVSLNICRKTHDQEETAASVFGGIDPLVQAFTKTLAGAIDQDITDWNKSDPKKSDQKKTDQKKTIRGCIIRIPVGIQSYSEEVKADAAIFASADFENNQAEVSNDIRDDIDDIEQAIIDKTFALSTKTDSNLYYYICDDITYHYVLYLKSDNSIILDEDLSDALEICAGRIADNLRYLSKASDQHDRSQELNLIKKLVRLSEREADENKFLRAVAANVRRELEVEWCCVHKYNPVTGYGNAELPQYDLCSVDFAKGGVILDEFDKRTYIPGVSLTGRVLGTGNYVISKNMFDDGRFLKENMKPFEARSITKSAFLGYPIKFEKPLIPDSKTTSKLTRTIGIITLGREKKFEKKEIQTIKIISTFVGKELERRRLIVQQELFHNYTTLLNLLPETLATCNTEESILEAVNRFAQQYLKEQYHSIFKLEEGILKMRSPKQYVNAGPPEFRIDEGQGLTNKIIRDGKPLFRLNFDQGKTDCKNFWLKIVGTDDRYFIGVPIKDPSKSNGYWGVFTLNGRKPPTFDPHFCESVTVEVVKSVASQISSALLRVNNDAGIDNTRAWNSTLPPLSSLSPLVQSSNSSM